MLTVKTESKKIELKKNMDKRFLFLIALSILIIGNLSYSEEVISLDEAGKYYNQKVSLEATVQSVTEKDDVYIFCLGRECDLTVVIPSYDFLKLLPYYYKSHYLGNRIRVSGLVSDSNGKPQIIIKEPNQIVVLESFGKKEVRDVNQNSEKELEDLAKKLQDERYWIREEAAHRLGEIKDKRSVDFLIAALKDKQNQDVFSREVREEAATALGKSGDKRAVEVLITSLNNEQIEFVKVNMVTALGNLGDIQALEPILEIVKNERKNGLLLETALRSLVLIIDEGMKDEQIQNIFLGFLRDKNSDFRKISAIGLDKMKWQPADSNERAVYYAAKQQWSNCAKLGRVSIEHLIFALKTMSVHFKDDEIGAIAVSLGKLKDKSTVEPLISLLNENDLRWSAKKGIVEALGEIGDNRAAAPVFRTLNDKNGFIRKKSAEALDKLSWKARDVNEQVIYLLAKENYIDCAKIGSNAVQPLNNLLKHKDEELRLLAAKALFEIGDLNSVPEFVKLLQDWHVKEVAASALGELGWEPNSIEEKIHYLAAKKDKKSLVMLWDDTKRVFLKNIESNEKEAVKNAAYTLISIGKDDVVADLVKTLNLKGKNGKDLAEIYLNSNKEELVKCAEEWAHKNYFFQLPIITDATKRTNWNSW